MTLPQYVSHPLEPIFDSNSRVLLLGTMPSPKSRENGFYYAHPQNRFWRVLEAVVGEPFGDDAPTRRRELLRHRIALWDVLSSCVIDGAADSSIRSAAANDISLILHAAPIRAVFTTGSTAAKLYRRLCLPETGMAAISLPSTSPANCRYYGFDDLVFQYRAILPFLSQPPEG